MASSGQPLRDQLGREISVERVERIVSLCPSTTETLFALDAGDRIVGRTDYCCHPAARVPDVPSVGGTKKVRLERLDELAPDLVVSVREENDREQIDVIAARWPTLILDPVDVASAVTGVELLGMAVGAPCVAGELACAIDRAFDELPQAGGARAVYLIWRKPYMAVGSGTYIDDVLRRLGIVNVAAELDGRYPEFGPEQFDELQPEWIFGSSEPFPFTDEHVPELQALRPAARVRLVDGEMFSWHGVRMLEAAKYFAEFVPQLS